MDKFKSIFEILKEKSETELENLTVDTVEELKNLRDKKYRFGTEVKVKEDDSVYILIDPIFHKWVKKALIKEG